MKPEEQVMLNLKSVRSEAMDMLDTIKAVKGERHKDLVHVMLMTGNLVEMFAFVERHSDIPEGPASTLRDNFLRCLYLMMAVALRTPSAEPEEIDAAIEDAESISQSVNSLAGSAVNAGLTGGKFGGNT